MEIDLSKYYLGEPDKTICHCGHPVHFLTKKDDIDIDCLILCTDCGEIASIEPVGKRSIIAKGGPSCPKCEDGRGITPRRYGEMHDFVCTICGHYWMQ